MSSKENIITIVGRRNVGKSTLFNALIRSRLAIVDDHPGLTRDVIKYHLEHDGVTALLSDTPGLDLPEGEELSTPILDRATDHLRTSSLIVLLLENLSLQSYDHELLNFCRRFNVPLIVAVNKMDSDKDLENMPEFFELGVTDILPISAKNGKNLDLLRDKVFSQLPRLSTSRQEPSIRVALIANRIPANRHC
jgi:GTP-binding protein